MLNNPSNKYSSFSSSPLSPSSGIPPIPLSEVDGIGGKDKYPIFLEKCGTFLYKYFDLEKKGVTIQSEVQNGFMHYISHVFLLTLVSNTMTSAGYPDHYLPALIAVLCGFGSIAVGVLTNMPIIIAPTPAIAVFLGSYIKVENVSVDVSNRFVVLVLVLVLVLFSFSFSFSFL